MEKPDKPELEERKEGKKEERKRKEEDYETKETRKKEGTSWIIPSISAKERRIRSVRAEIRINVAAEAEENAEDKRGQGALAKVGAERKLRGPCRREEGDVAIDERWRKKRRGWMGTGKAVSRLSDVEIDGKTRTEPKGRCEKREKKTRRTRRRRRKGRKGKGMRRNSLSAFLPVAKLRIDVSRHDSTAWKLRLGLKHIQTHIHVLEGAVLRHRLLLGTASRISSGSTVLE
ncbi:hypothetical protein K0M31_012748 [Melipona bicolor]|uniref:Uncharacterized protein n=1 Tax=Melipona bicolor TaxID=60889 RepID=A0AA40FJ19_9HYME|nr:hypothetical protein K0M31_012748 [Melipona bicolor]